MHTDVMQEYLRACDTKMRERVITTPRPRYSDDFNILTEIDGDNDDAWIMETMQTRRTTRGGARS
jgi:hypothetical protein